MLNFENLAKKLNVCGRFMRAVDLSTYKGGGEAFVFLPSNMEEFVKTANFLRNEQIEFSVLGGGSNMLVNDGICKHVFVSTRMLNGVQIANNKVVCECGAKMANVISQAREHNLGGLEFLCGVPCCVGGAIKMNAGAFSSQIGDYIDKITVLSVDNENLLQYTVSQKSKDDIGFSYRNGAKDIVLSAEISLEYMEREHSLKRGLECLKKRRSKQPNLPSLGSVFKNGESASAKIIEECGLKGICHGGAQISPMHSNFIVNIGGGTAQDYLYLALLCEEEAQKRFGVELKREFVFVD